MRLSKSRFVAGIQCHGLLWLKVHEPDAVELQPDIVLQDRFDQGTRVGELAQTWFPGGVLIDFPYYQVDAKIAATSEALAAGAPSIFEASFVADNTFVAVDVLERLDGGFRLIEVKSSSSQKDEHIPDAAVQRHVLGRCGIDVLAVEIMHLNKQFRHPDEGDLFARTDVTTQVDEWVGRVPAELEAQLAMLAGPRPDMGIGSRCFDPRECPFKERCWPDTPNHISKLYTVGRKKTVQYMHAGVHTIDDLPPGKKLHAAAQRQLRAMEQNQLIVEPGLAQALEPFDCRLGFLDFETISRAIPVWPGMGPWHSAAAQFSYHERRGDGTYSHSEFLAEGPDDARAILAEAMIEATKNAERVVMYTSFETTQIRNLKAAVPHLAAELEELEHKLIDLFPVVRDYVYHPDFQGSFSLKFVLPALVPEVTYDDLVIEDGMVASVEISRLLFVTGELSPKQHQKTRHDLLEYCKRDTWATVKVLERLRELAGA